MKMVQLHNQVTANAIAANIQPAPVAVAPAAIIEHAWYFEPCVQTAPKT
jgi:hypothetical protein